MSGIKDLFEKNKGSEILSDASLSKVGSGIESADYVKSNIKEKERFVPYIDFTTASNFARYGLAEKYYSDSIGYITSEYPYDGSLKEKSDWNLSASYLDRYIFENEYPRTNGYIVMGLAKPTGSTAYFNGYSWQLDENQLEYIFVKGSPKPPTGSGPLRTDWKYYNLYNTSSTGRYNLEINGDNGFAVEFWWKKDSFDAASQGHRQVIFDLWNSGSSQGAVDAAPSGDWGRFTVEVDPGAYESYVDTSKIYVRVFSGSDGFSSSSLYRQDSSTYDLYETLIPIGQNLTLVGANWAHYAINVFNTGSQMAAELYVDGKLNDTVITGSSINPVTGAMLATLGSVITDAAGSTSLTKGDGWLSASLDDFRFWRRKRTVEQIGRNWFTQVGGGGNTDITNAATSSTKYSYENPLDLGLYYKFNEGITATASFDNIVLDYSGRTNNGTWVGYTGSARFTGSAILEGNAASSEFKDPVIYPNHPDVLSLSTTKQEKGREHDYNNAASIFHTIPSWIIEENQGKSIEPLKNLTQIIASYFDTLQLQIDALPSIKNVRYPSGSDKPYPFSYRFLNSLGLVSSDIFTNATDLEYLASRNDHKNFAKKIEETKSIIYQNIYNNLNYIYKCKGTEKSFRNLIRCFGVDEELIKINLYGNDITHELRNNIDYRIIKKRYANFYTANNTSASVFQQTASSNSNSRGYISCSADLSFRGNTYEAEAIFGANLNKEHKNYIGISFLSSSLFGCHNSGSTHGWGSPDYGNFQVYAVRPSVDSTDVYFQLTGSSEGYFPLLTSSLFRDVYDDSKWNFAVKIKPDKYPIADGVSGSAEDANLDPNLLPYNVEFSGYNYVLDSLVDSFSVTTNIDSLGAQRFLTANKRFYVGAHRTNFTDGVLQYSSAKVSSLRVWMDYLSDDIIQAHAQDAENFGSKYPYKNSYISQLSKSLGDNIVNIPQMETLALHWNFDTVTGADSSGQFIVEDISSGSTTLADRWGWLGPIAKYQHTGMGYKFPNSSTSSVERRFVHSAKQQLPETLNSADMISIVDDTDRQIFSRDSRPIDYYFAFEKSMYGIVSEQMLNFFSTIVAFNNLIGEPVNRYRQEYKDLEKLRSLYFEGVDNTPDFEKFVEYFKWIDSAIGLMLVQLAPATSEFSEKLRNMIESHILERNKYWTKFPTLEAKFSDPEAGVRGISEMLYSAKRGLASIPTTASSNCEWWFERAERDGSDITSGDSAVDDQRNIFRLTNDFRTGSGPNLAVSRNSTTITTTYEGQTYAVRNFTKPYRFVLDESPEIRGGSNFPPAKRFDYINTLRDISQTLKVSASSIASEKGCTDVIDPNLKNRLEYKFLDINDIEGHNSGKGVVFAPFSLFSSSVAGGYASDISTNFRAKTDITNYHDDVYGDTEVPAQGPFTEKHVGGRQHRHANINTASADDATNRAEIWNLTLESELMTITPPIDSNATQPRATYFRDELAKRPLNLRNIKWDTGSQAAGNYRKDYEMIQTVGRTTNNRFFVDNEGFSPSVVASPYVSGVIDFALPRYDLTGTNKYVFVERFSAPGGPEINSRGNLDIYAEEYSVYNNLNYRNLIVRNALRGWQSEHCGQFGIDPTGSPGDGTTPSEHTVDAASYDGVIAAYHKVNRNFKKVGVLTDGFGGAATCSNNYDNWFVQHPIPQSDYQYAWITASISQSVCDTFGHTSNFSVPSGSTATTASVIPFISASDFGSYRIAAGRRWGDTANYVASSNSGFIGTDFVGINFNIYEPLTSSDNNLGYPLSVPILDTVFPTVPTQYINAGPNNKPITGYEGVVSSFDNSVSAYVVAGLNALLLHRNGPYQYPSWKQIRTGETPIARYQRRNNILSIMEQPSYITLDNGNGTTQPAAVFWNSRTDKQKQFLEPPVVFKYKPVDTVMASMEPLFEQGGVQRAPRPSLAKLRHTYGNNKCLFSPEPVHNPSTPAGSPPSESVSSWIDSTLKKADSQIYDAMRADPTIWPRVNTTLYKEVVYPREANAGLAKIRGRTQYAEVTSGTLQSDGTFSASLSDGQNGIDRGPLERRTFWRDKEIYRNRRSGYSKDLKGVVGVGYVGFIITGTIPNSQGIKNGHATGVWPMGSSPLCYPRTAADSLREQQLSASSGGTNDPALFQDTGELNSINYQIMMGYAGTGASSSISVYEDAKTLSGQCTWYPTASAFYYHLPLIRRYSFKETTSQMTGEKMAAGLRYVTPELSGKKPWFDSYEEYAEDIRGLGKSFTIIPEFRISDHMDYYLRKNSGDFKAQNDRFLSLNGAEITSSAYDERTYDSNNNPVSDIRGFDETFFNDYSMSDFQQYFGKFSEDNELKKITLKCRGIKKLLPYNGFYPQQRTLQLASLFSQSLGPHITGIKHLAGQSTDTSNPPSGALATQALLQPFFAPGILYNTIKSGIAVSWGAYTGSAPLTVGINVDWPTSVTCLDGSPNYIIPFEAIVDPLGHPNGIPKQSDAVADPSMMLLMPTYLTGNNDPAGGIYSATERAADANGGVGLTLDNNGIGRRPFVKLDGLDRANADDKNGLYGLYTLAMSNFLAETPNFFLSTDSLADDPGTKLKTIVSTVDAGGVQGNLVADTSYYMDIYLKKSTDLVMMKENEFYSSGTSPGFPGPIFDMEGRLFGPPVDPTFPFNMTSSGGNRHGEIAPAYAPYTPPYFYGESRVTLKYSPNADQISNFTYQNFLNDVTATYSNPDLENRFEFLRSSPSSSHIFGAQAGMMQISSSINFKGVFTPPEITTNPNGNIIRTEGRANSALSKWVISPKMETPVLDFTDQPEYHPFARGMWSGYGKMPENKSIEFGIVPTETILASDSNTGSLIDIMFKNTTLDNKKKSIGEMAARKKISEAIVAIPYIEYNANTESFRQQFAHLTKKPILGKYFFALGGDKTKSSEIFTVIRKNLRAEPPMAIPQDSVNWAKQFGLDQPKARTSISQMIAKMERYMLPPELDFGTYDGGTAGPRGNNFIEPFAMYIMEFEHTLERQDLIDIWQGLMPKISTTAEEAVVEYPHDAGPLEFFGGRKIPSNVRWMVFKVKKRADLDYHRLTAETTDDERFSNTNAFSVKNNEIIYSYNWPYDYFSLVELAELEIANEFTGSTR